MEPQFINPEVNVNEPDLDNPEDYTVLEDENLELPPDMDIKEIEEKAIEWRRKWNEWVQPLKTNWEENKSLYITVETSPINGVASRSGEIFTTINTEIPALANSVISKSEVVRNDPKTQDIANLAPKIMQYINQSILINSKGRMKIREAFKSFLVYGTAIGKTSLLEEQEKEFIGIDPQTQQVVNDWVFYLKARPNFENISIFDYFQDPDFIDSDIQKVEWQGNRTYHSVEDIKLLSQQGKCLPVDDTDLASVAIKDGRQQSRDIAGGSSSKKKNKCTIDEFWATLYWEDEEGESQSGEYWFWLLNEKKIIKVKKNLSLHRPYMAARLYTIDGMFFGRSEIDEIKSVSKQMGIVQRMAGLLQKKSAKTLMMYTEGSNWSKNTSKQKLAGEVLVSDLNGVREMPNTASQGLKVALDYLDYLNKNAQSISGVNELLRGEELGDTAYEAALIQQNASSRLTPKLQNFQDEYIVPLAEQFFMLAKQFVTEESFSFQGDTINLTSDDFRGSYYWSATGSVSQANRALAIQQRQTLANQIVTMLQAAPVAAQQGFDLIGFMKNEWLPYYDIPDINRYFTGGQAQPMGMPGQPPLPPQAGPGQLTPPQTPSTATTANVGNPLPKSDIMEVPSPPITPGPAK